MLQPSGLVCAFVRSAGKHSAGTFGLRRVECRVRTPARRWRHAAGNPRRSFPPPSRAPIGDRRRA